MKGQLLQLAKFNTMKKLFCCCCALTWLRPGCTSVPLMVAWWGMMETKPAVGKGTLTPAVFHNWCCCCCVCCRCCCFCICWWSWSCCPSVAQSVFVLCNCCCSCCVCCSICRSCVRRCCCLCICWLSCSCWLLSRSCSFMSCCRWSSCWHSWWFSSWYSFWIAISCCCSVAVVFCGMYGLCSGGSVKGWKCTKNVEKCKQCLNVSRDY